MGEIDRWKEKDSDREVRQRYERSENGWEHEEGRLLRTESNGG